MNSRNFNRIVLQGLRHNNLRYLSVQRNINKCSSSTCVDFRRRNYENRSSSFIFTKILDNRSLCQSSSLPVHTYFQRNFSGTSQLNHNVDADPLQNLADKRNTEDIYGNLPASIFPDDTVENYIVQCGQQFLFQLHDATGLSWWATIALSVVFIRTCIVLPFAMTQIRMMAKLEKINLKLTNLEKSFKREITKAGKKFGWPDDIANEKLGEAKNTAYWSLIYKENCHPMKTYFLVTAQGSALLTMSSAVATLCLPHFCGPVVFEQMSQTGIGWITDLTVVDPYYILPVAIGLVNLCVVEVHNTFRVTRKARYERYKFIGYRLVALSTIALASYLPAAINIYWLSSSCYGLVQAFVLNSAPVRRVLRVPMNDPQLAQPYRYFLNTTKERLRLTKGGDTSIEAAK